MYEVARCQAHAERQKLHRDLDFFEKPREIARVTFAANNISGHALMVADAAAVLPKTALPAIGGATVLGGALGIPLGMAAMRNSALRWNAARRSGDPEGATQGALWGLHGVGLTGVSSLLAAEGVMRLMGTAVPMALLPATGGFGILAAGGAFGYGLHGWREAARFHKAFHLAQKGGIHNTLQFLDQQINLSPQELDGTHDQMVKDLHKKWNALERQVGSRCADQIREEIPSLLQCFDPQKAHTFIQSIDRENFKARVRYITLFFAGLIGMFSFIALFLTTQPMIAPLLCILGASMMITVDAVALHNWIGEKLWVWHHPEEMGEQEPCQIPTAS